MHTRVFSILGGVLGVVMLASMALFAQEPSPGKLKLTVHPGEAYTFVDGNAIGPGNRTVTLTPGNHHLIVANYGFKFFEKDISIEPNQKLPMDVALEPAGADVKAPWGRIQIEENGVRSGDAAVLLNGQKPAYFVGHGDEFNNDIIWHQELLVPPGTHKVTVTRHGQEIWSGMVPVQSNQRVILWVPTGKMVTKDWPRGSEFAGGVGRFKAGIASARIAIAPVSGSVAANPAKINCGQPSTLVWNSAETIDADMSGMSPVTTTGEKIVSPKQTTTYEFTAVGPGGVTKSNTTLEVNPVVQSSIGASPAEVRYRRIGDKVIEQGSTNLNWTSSNADAATLNPLGTVATTGTKSVNPVPAQTANGPVDENVNYTLTATNVCGGAETKTVAVRVKGSIEPIPTVLLKSVFYPTDYPDKLNPNLGLLSSQRETLKAVAAGFTKYLEYDPDAKLSLRAHADPRGGAKFNEALALRRAELTKQFLVSQGTAAEKIEVTAVGEEQPLEAKVIAQLEAENPNPAPKARAAQKSTTNLAYQRRVDIVLSPTKAESARFYPNTAADSKILWQLPKPPRSAVKKNE
jgi:outer membrane protein OmpA-like peptidoglycan-associated protein